MKKLLAGLLSLTMLCTPILQVSAIDYNEDGEMLGRVYTVIGSFSETYTNGETYEYCYLNNGCVISPNRVSDAITLEYGDVIWLQADCIEPIDPGRFGEIQKIEYLGKAQEYYGITKELTVVKIENSQKFQDEQGNLYSWSSGWSFQGEGSLKLEFCRDDFHVGDKAIFVINDDDIVLPLEFTYKAEVDESINLNPVETEVSAGDANGDSEVDIVDVIAMNKVILGQKQFTAEQVKVCDFNQNGMVDPDDSLLLMEYIVGLIDVLN